MTLLRTLLVARGGEAEARGGEAVEEAGVGGNVGGSVGGGTVVVLTFGLAPVEVEVEGCKRNEYFYTASITDDTHTHNCSPLRLSPPRWRYIPPIGASPPLRQQDGSS